jgi:hypothetical protein
MEFTDRLLESGNRAKPGCSPTGQDRRIDGLLIRGHGEERAADNLCMAKERAGVRSRRTAKARHVLVSISRAELSPLLLGVVVAVVLVTAASVWIRGAGTAMEALSSMVFGLSVSPDILQSRWVRRSDRDWAMKHAILLIARMHQPDIFDRVLTTRIGRVVIAVSRLMVASIAVAVFLAAAASLTVAVVAGEVAKAWPSCAIAFATSLLYFMLLGRVHVPDPQAELNHPYITLSDVLQAIEHTKYRRCIAGLSFIMAFLSAALL